MSKKFINYKPRPDGQPIAILHIMSSSGLGGTETVCAQVLETMDRSAFVNDVIFLDGRGEVTGRYKPLARKLTLTGEVSIFRSIVRVIRFARDSNPDVVFAAGFKANISWRLARLFSKSLRNAAYVMHLRNIYTMQRPTRSRIWLDRNTMGGVQLIMSNCKASLLALTEQGYQEKPALVAYNGALVDRFRFTPGLKPIVRKELGLDPDQPVLICVANFRPEKNHALLLDAFRIVVNECPSARLILVGEIPPDSPAPALVKSIELEDRIQLLGQRRDVDRLLQAADVFILASHFEGLPGAIQEAMAAELPVVATAVGGVPELIEDGKTGFTVPRGDADTLAKKTLMLLNNPSWARQMGRAGREKLVRQFTLAAQTRVWEQAARLALSLKWGWPPPENVRENVETLPGRN